MFRRLKDLRKIPSSIHNEPDTCNTVFLLCNFVSYACVDEFEAMVTQLSEPHRAEQVARPQHPEPTAKSKTQPR